MGGESGFIYLAINPNMSGLVKIGKAQNVEERMSQLSAPTSVPGQFECMFSMAVENPRIVENNLHALYEYCRVDSNREFFKVDWQAVRATLLAMDVADTEDEVLITSESDTEEEQPLEFVNTEDLPPILISVQQNNLQEVQRLIDGGEDLNLKQRFGWQSLTTTYKKWLIGELLALNPDVLMNGDCEVVKALIIGLIKQTPKRLYTSQIARWLGIDTASVNGGQTMWFCHKILNQLKKERRLDDDPNGRCYWLIPNEDDQ